MTEIANTPSITKSLNEYLVALPSMSRSSMSRCFMKFNLFVWIRTVELELVELLG